MGTTLLRQKLSQPPVWPEALVRDRLHHLLDEAIAHGQHIALVAGSGYGKSSLLAHWSQGRSASWLTLDAEDADLDTFLAYLIAACEALAPGFRTEASAMLARAREREGAVAALSVLLSDLDEQCDAPGVLILDDYHLAASPSLDGLIVRMLKYLPPSIRLVLSSRLEPAVELTGFQAKRQMKLLGERDLSFNQGELGRLRPELTAQALASLAETTGGCPAAMGMTPESLDAYLHEQVLVGQPAEEVSFLMRASLVEAFDTDLCEALGAPLTAGRRDWLLRHRLVLPFEDGRLCVPQPLRAMLRRRYIAEVSRSERQETLRRVGDHLWSARQEASAIRFWVEAGESEWAAEKLIGVAEAWLVDGRLEALSNAVGALSEAGKRPELQLAEGEVHRRWGDFSRAEACFEAASRLFTDAEGLARTRLRLAMTAAGRGQVQPARELLAAVRPELATGDRFEIDARNLEGGLELLGGSTATALDHFQASLRLSRRLADPYAEARAIHNLGVCYTRLGEFRRSLECYDEAMARTSPDGTPTVWMTPINRALVLTYLDRTAEALTAAETALDMVRRYKLPREEGYALRTLGFAQSRLGLFEAARTSFESAELLARWHNDGLGIAYSLNFQAELAATLGDVPSALRLCEQTDAQLGNNEAMRRIPEFLHVRTKVLLLVGKYDEAKAQLEILREAIQHESQKALLHEIEGLLDSPSSLSAPVVTAREAASVELSIRCFGGLRVRRAGQEIGEREWQSARAKLLLAYLLHTPEGAHKARLLEALYPNEETTDASLNMNMMRLRKALEPGLEKGQPSRFILRSDGRYSFNRQAHFELDTLSFEAALRSAQLSAPGGEAAALRAALDVYGGDFLPEFEHDWVVGMRHRLRDLALGACRRLLELEEESGSGRTLDVVHQALVIDPLSEEFHRELILRFIEAEEPHRALEHYRLCERRFQEQLGMPPPDDLGALVADLGA